MDEAASQSPQQNLAILFQQVATCDPAADACVLSDTLTDVAGAPSR